MRGATASALVAFVTVSIILSCSSRGLARNLGVSAFQSPPLLPTSTRAIKLVRNRGSDLYALEGAIASIDAFNQSQPFLSAFVTCGVKASAADLLAQTSAASTDEEDTSVAVVAKSEQPSSEDNINVNRNFAFLLYGGLYQGMFLQFLYSFVFPFLYGDSEYRVVLQVLTDILVFGPFLTLPIAYVIKQFLAEGVGINDESDDISIVETFKKGINKYKNHVETQGILFKYWSIWAPAQTLTFGVVPPHLRVVFVAFVSFFWVTVLSDVSSREETPPSRTVD